MPTGNKEKAPAGRSRDVRPVDPKGRHGDRSDRRHGHDQPEQQIQFNKGRVFRLLNGDPPNQLYLVVDESEADKGNEGGGNNCVCFRMKPVPASMKGINLRECGLLYGGIAAPKKIEGMVLEPLRVTVKEHAQLGGPQLLNYERLWSIDTNTADAVDIGELGNPPDDRRPDERNPKPKSNMLEQLDTNYQKAVFDRVPGKDIKARHPDNNPKQSAAPPRRPIPDERDNGRRGQHAKQSTAPPRRPNPDDHDNEHKDPKKSSAPPKRPNPDDHEDSHRDPKQSSAPSKRPALDKLNDNGHRDQKPSSAPPRRPSPDDSNDNGHRGEHPKQSSAPPRRPVLDDLSGIVHKDGNRSLLPPKRPAADDPSDIGHRAKIRQPETKDLQRDQPSRFPDASSGLEATRGIGNDEKDQHDRTRTSRRPGASAPIHSRPPERGGRQDPMNFRGEPMDGDRRNHRRAPADERERDMGRRGGPPPSGQRRHDGNGRGLPSDDPSERPERSGAPGRGPPMSNQNDPTGRLRDPRKGRKVPSDSMPSNAPNRRGLPPNSLPERPGPPGQRPMPPGNGRPPEHTQQQLLPPSERGLPPSTNTGRITKPDPKNTNGRRSTSRGKSSKMASRIRERMKARKTPPTDSRGQDVSGTDPRSRDPSDFNTNERAPYESIPVGDPRGRSIPEPGMPGIDPERGPPSREPRDPFPSSRDTRRELPPNDMKGPPASGRDRRNGPSARDMRGQPPSSRDMRGGRRPPPMSGSRGGPPDMAPSSRDNRRPPPLSMPGSRQPSSAPYSPVQMDRPPGGLESPMGSPPQSPIGRGPPPPRGSMPRGRGPPPRNGHPRGSMGGRERGPPLRNAPLAGRRGTSSMGRERGPPPSMNGRPGMSQSPTYSPVGVGPPPRGGPSSQMNSRTGPPPRGGSPPQLNGRSVPPMNGRPGMPQSPTYSPIGGGPPPHGGPPGSHMESPPQSPMGRGPPPQMNDRPGISESPMGRSNSPQSGQYPGFGMESQSGSPTGRGPPPRGNSMDSGSGWDSEDESGSESGSHSGSESEYSGIDSPMDGPHYGPPTSMPGSPIMEAPPGSSPMRYGSPRGSPISQSSSRRSSMPGSPGSPDTEGIRRRGPKGMSKGSFDRIRPRSPGHEDAEQSSEAEGCCSSYSGFTAWVKKAMSSFYENDQNDEDIPMKDLKSRKKRRRDSQSKPQLDSNIDGEDSAIATGKDPHSPHAGDPFGDSDHDDDARTAVDNDDGRSNDGGEVYSDDELYHSHDDANSGYDDQIGTYNEDDRSQYSSANNSRRSSTVVASEAGAHDRNHEQPDGQYGNTHQHDSNRGFIAEMDSSQGYTPHGESPFSNDNEYSPGDDGCLPPPELRSDYLNPHPAARSFEASLPEKAVELASDNNPPPSPPPYAHVPSISNQLSRPRSTRFELDCERAPVELEVPTTTRGHSELFLPPSLTPGVSANPHSFSSTGSLSGRTPPGSQAPPIPPMPPMPPQPTYSPPPRQFTPFRPAEEPQSNLPEQPLQANFGPVQPQAQPGPSYPGAPIYTANGEKTQAPTFQIHPPQGYGSSQTPPPTVPARSAKRPPSYPPPLNSSRDNGEGKSGRAALNSRGPSPRHGNKNQKNQRTQAPKPKKNSNPSDDEWNSEVNSESESDSGSDSESESDSDSDLDSGFGTYAEDLAQRNEELQADNSRETPASAPASPSTSAPGSNARGVPAELHSDWMPVVPQGVPKQDVDRSGVKFANSKVAKSKRPEHGMGGPRHNLNPLDIPSTSRQKSPAPGPSRDGHARSNAADMPPAPRQRAPQPSGKQSRSNTAAISPRPRGKPASSPLRHRSHKSKSRPAPSHSSHGNKKPPQPSEPERHRRGSADVPRSRPTHKRQKSRPPRDDGRKRRNPSDKPTSSRHRPRNDADMPPPGHPDGPPLSPVDGYNSESEDEEVQRGPIRRPGPGPRPEDSESEVEEIERQLTPRPGPAPGPESDIEDSAGEEEEDERRMRGGSGPGPGPESDDEHGGGPESDSEIPSEMGDDGPPEEQEGEGEEDGKGKRRHREKGKGHRREKGGERDKKRKKRSNRRSHRSSGDEPGKLAKTWNFLKKLDYHEGSSSDRGRRDY